MFQKTDVNFAELWGDPLLRLDPLGVTAVSEGPNSTEGKNHEK